jgi:hypothetical protein
MDLGSHFGLIVTHRVSICSGTLISIIFAGILFLTRTDIPPDYLCNFFSYRMKIDIVL